MELPKNYDPQEAEPRLQEFWEKNNIYQFNPDSNKQIFSIDTPPPTISGKMHMGHAFGNSQQDFIARYKRMQGFNVLQPFGTDDNGLPTQLLIQKLKHVRAQDLSRKEFTELCLKTLKEELRPKYLQDWKRLGISCDFNVSYTTIDKHSQKISQKSFIDLYKDNQAYRTYSPAMVCPKCRTSIAQVELEDFKRTSTLNHIKAKVENEHVTFATTRPELMMACIAITVHPEDERYKHLIGKDAEIPCNPNKVPILADNLTKMEFGSGVVYWCPYGDAADIEFVVKHPELKVRHIMNKDGKLNELAGKYQGMNGEEARAAVLEDWEKANAIVKQEPTEQVVNAHERCGTPIEFVAMNQWAIKVKDKKETWLNLGNQLNWYPKHMKNRYDNWAKGLKWDWNISRQIYFGIPFPVWYCEKCEEPIMANESQLPVDPTEDQPPIKECPKCQHNKLIPEKDIINTWATSSLTPTIVKELFKGKLVYDKLTPMNLRPQGHDIISFWLFNTVVKSHLHYNQLPWKDCFINGWMLDHKGKKMSKSKGNVIEPQVMIKKYSADALRFMSGGCKLGDDLPFPEKDVLTGQKFVTKLWNSAKFCFMHLEDYEKSEITETFDKWLLSKLNSLIKSCTENFEKYEFSRTRLDVDKFFWHTFCDQYLEIVKDRLYNPEQRGVRERRSAQDTLYNTLNSLLKLMAPITPFITEEVYKLYFASKENKNSIHTSEWPKHKDSLIDNKIELIGDLGVDIINTVRKWKSTNQFSMKEEISILTLIGEDKDFESMIKNIENDLKAVLKIKIIKFSGKTTLETDSFNIKVGIEK